MKLIPLIPILVLLALLVGIALLATQLKPPEAERILEKAMENLFEVKAVRYQGTVELAVEGAAEEMTVESGVIVLNFNGAIDASEPENIEGAAEVSFSASGRDTEFSGEVEFRNIGQDFYVKVSALPASLSAFLSEELLAALENQWLSIEGEKLKELAGQEVDYFDKAKTKAILADLKLLFQGKKFFDIEKDFGKGHYLASVNKESLKAVIPEYLELAKKYLPEAQLAQYEIETEEALEKLPQAIDDIWLKINGIKFEAWVENKGRLEQLKFAREISGSELKELLSGSELTAEIENAKVNILFDLKFSDFNKKVEIEVPEDAKGLEELLAPLLMSASPVPSDLEE